MQQVEIKMMNDTKTIPRKSLDFLLGFPGSLVVANMAIVLIAH